MRFRDLPTRGRPTALTNELEELVVLTLGAIESSNVERWALAFGAALPPILPGTLRTNSYETEVVGSVHRLGQRYWERRGEAAIWERPFLVPGQTGRPPAIDIALFNSVAGTETRVEFGLYTKTKLGKDAEKLAKLSATTEDGFGTVTNYVVLWLDRNDKLTGPARRRLVRRFQGDAEAVASVDVPTMAVELLMISGCDLFTDRAGNNHWVAAGLFKITS